MGLTPVSTRGSTKEVLAEAGRHTLRVGKDFLQGGESQQPAKPWGWQGAAQRRRPAGWGWGQNLPVPAATGRGQGHACAHPSLGLHLPCSALPRAGDQTWHLIALVFSVPPEAQSRQSRGRAFSHGSWWTLSLPGSRAPNLPPLCPPAPQPFQPSPGHPQLPEDTRTVPWNQARMWLRGPQLLTARPSAPRAVEGRSLSFPCLMPRASCEFSEAPEHGFMACTRGFPLQDLTANREAQAGYTQCHQPSGLLPTWRGGGDPLGPARVVGSQVRGQVKASCPPCPCHGETVLPGLREAVCQPLLQDSASLRLSPALGLWDPRESGRTPS